jgi:lysophospholipase L1-like esterase
MRFAAIAASSGAGGPLTKVATSAASASAGPFSASNFFTGDADPELSADTSIAILWYSSAYTSAENLWGNSSASTGFYFTAWSGSGSVGDTYGLTRLNLPGGTGTINGQRQKLGLNCTVLAHTSGGDIKQSTNGSPAETIASSVTYVETSGASHFLGKAHTGSAAANHRVIEVAYFDAAVSDADMQTISGVIAENESYRLNDTARSHGNLVWSNHFDDDWDGGSTCASGRGSGSNTFTKSGTVAQNTIAAEDVYTYDRSLLWHTATPTDETDYYGADCWSVLRLTTDAEEIRVRCRQEGVWFNWYAVGTDQDGVAGPHGDIVEEPDSTTCADIVGLSAGSKTLDVYPGLHATNRLGLFHTGKFSVPAGSSVVAVAPTSPTNRCVIVGDSISVGQDAFALTEKAWPLQLRRLLGDSWGITSDGHGSRAVAIDAGDLEGLAADIVTRCDGVTRNVVLWQLGTVDWGAAYGTSKATYKSRVETVLDEINSLDGDIEVIAVTPFSRSGEDTPNAGAAVLQDYRDALNELASTRAWLSVIEGPELVPYATGTDSDGLHLNNAGSDSLAERIKVELDGGSIGETGWALWLRYSADAGLGAGQATWANQEATSATLNEQGSITLNSADSAYNDQDTLSFDGSSAYWQMDEGTLPRSELDFMHEGAESYWGFIVFDATGGDELLINNQAALTKGIQLLQRTTTGFVRFSIFNDSAQHFAQSADASAPGATKQIAFFRFDIASGKAGVRAQGAVWVDASGTLSPTAGSTGRALALMAAANATAFTEGKLAAWGLRRALPSAALEASIEAQIVAQYDL